MIQSIEIENFRCFDKTEIKGFGQINLITGKNNVGKTCLLEALYFMLSQNVQQTGQIRNADFSLNLESVKDFLFNPIKGIINFSFEISNILWSGDFDTSNVQHTTAFSSTLGVIERKQVDLILDKSRRIPKDFSLVRLIDDAKIKGFYEQILAAIKTIDNDIEELTSYASYPNILFVKKKGNNRYLPSSSFGDAFQKVLSYIAVIFRNTNSTESYLLIDEIENGIHYTAQKEVWQMLFKLCKSFNVQLFATTHSHEMIKAFEEVCEEFENQGAYFELARHAKTNQIIGIKHETSLLEYELQTNTAIRGE
jgi:AAA15 family ATPase/GTPase